MPDKDNEKVLTNKDIRNAMNRFDMFKTLSPEDQLNVLASMIVSKGNIRDEYITYWNSHYVASDEHPDYYSRVQFIKTLISDSKAGNNLKLANEHGLYEFCLSKFKPFKNSIAKRDFKDMTKKMDKAESDPDIRMCIICFTMGHKDGYSVLKYYDTTDEARNNMGFAIEHLEEYMLIRQPFHLKEFLARWGGSKINYLDNIEENIIKVIDMPHYKHLSKDYMFDQIHANGEPVFLKDLALTADDCRALGMDDDERIKYVRKLLLRHVHKYFRDNEYDKLSSMAVKMYKSNFYCKCVDHFIFKMR
ncbi:MAG: hypothetical protein HUJ79_01355 [Firmicutes bacterium]|nr:hypothetical protein [Bacillota bacterium]